MGPVSFPLPLWPGLGSGLPELGHRGGREGWSGAGVHTGAASRGSIGQASVKLCLPEGLAPPRVGIDSRAFALHLLKDSLGPLSLYDLKAPFPHTSQTCDAWAREARRGLHVTEKEARLRDTGTGPPPAPAPDTQQRSSPERGPHLPTQFSLCSALAACSPCPMGHAPHEPRPHEPRPPRTTPLRAASLSHTPARRMGVDWSSLGHREDQW